ncbi:hypothetical protein [Serratia sp. (in: enterobacteria)]|uniref:hypothetical protein n=1 Tax=Serratia sp. (in: enterobacteria) TaxID=616 RepID=UPI003989AFCE
MSVTIGGSSNKGGYQCTTSSIEMQEQEAPLPNAENRGYFQVRTSFCQRFPDVITQKMKNGSERMLKLKQVLLSGIIQFEEIKLHQWRYEYRAEVSYLMLVRPPRPFISKNQGQPGNRRRTLNPVPLRGGIPDSHRIYGVVKAFFVRRVCLRSQISLELSRLNFLEIGLEKIK